MSDTVYWFRKEEEAQDMLRRLFALSLVSGLAFAADPLLGTWKINTAKATYSPGPGPKSGMVTFTEEGGWILSKGEQVTADGATTNYTNRYKRDGKPYPFESQTGKGMISMKNAGEREVN